MPKESMNAKERWQAVFEGRLPDRVPMDYWATGEANEKLMAYMGVGSIREAWDKLHIDYVVHVGPRYVGPKLPPNTDVYGIKHESIDYGTGEYSEVANNPLAQYSSVEEIEANYTWPSKDWYSYDHIPEQIKGQEDHPIRGGGSEPFLVYKSLRGQEQAFIDLIENPEIVHYCLDKLFDLAYAHTIRIYEQIPDKVMTSYLAEDMGAQYGLMFSPAQIKEFLVPRMKKMADIIHEGGAYAFHHNDGAVRKILPTMIDEVGIDLLNPIQWRTVGMEREELKRDFGDKLVFHGAMDNQYTLPFGTVEEVRQEVRDNIAILGEGGGYILAPCHNIQAVGPAENIVAMYEEAYNEGWY